MLSSVLISPDSAGSFSPAPYRRITVSWRPFPLLKEAFKCGSLGKVLFHHLSHALSCGQQVGTEWLLRFNTERKECEREKE